MFKNTIRTTTCIALLMTSIGSYATPITNDLELWLDADTLNSATTAVTNWSDQSGNARNATASGTAQTPSYTANNTLFSNHATVSFDGNDNLSSALGSVMNIDGNKERTIFFVYSQDVASSSNIFGYGSNQGLKLFDIAATSQKISGHFHNTPFINGSQTFALNQMTVGSVRYDGATFEAFQHDISFNGLTRSATYALNTGDSAFKIGSGIYSNYNSFRGDIAEILVYSGALSNTDRMAVDSYLFNKYTSNPSAATVSAPGTLALMTIMLVGLGIKKRKF